MKTVSGNRLTRNAAHLRTLQLVLLVLTVCVIWGHSLMPADISDQESDQVSEYIEKHDLWLFRAPLLFLPLRKLAHMVEYAALGFQLRLFRKGSGRILRAWLPGFFVAFIDETLQLATPGRNGNLRDVWLDAAGVAVGILLALLLLRLLRGIASRPAA